MSRQSLEELKEKHNELSNTPMHVLIDWAQMYTIIIQDDSRTQYEVRNAKKSLKQVINEIHKRYKKKPF